MESRLPAVSEWGGGGWGWEGAVESCSRVVAITSNEMQGGMHDGRLFRAGFTKYAVFSIVLHRLLLLQASCQTRMSRGCCARES